MSCSSSSKREKEIQKIDVNVDYALFHQDFFTSKPEDVERLKSNYPYMFPKNLSEDAVVQRMKDSLQKEIYEEVNIIYPNFTAQQHDLDQMFKHIKYYYPNFVLPTVVTDVTGLSYQDKVLYANNLLLISLDMYLGKQHQFYNGFPGYIKEHFTTKGMIVDVAKTIINTKYKVNRDRTFLGRMIFEGKKAYLLEVFLPKIPDFVKMGYSENKMNWAKQNQAGVWSYFIKNDLLYSNNQKLNKRFIDLAPFSKFYTAQDKSTPGSIAKYIGLQIVTAYMEKNKKVTVQQMLNTDAQSILNQSAFKPKK